MFDPEQIVCDEGVPVTATALGLTATVDVIAVPLQPPSVGVMVNVTVVVVDPLVFVRAPVILPEPLAAIPVTEVVLFLVQL
jgi:hypothetical protein